MSNLLLLISWIVRRPTSVRVEIHDPDRTKRARNLKLARKAWIRGESFVNPSTLARLEKIHSRTQHARHIHRHSVFARH